MTTDPFKEPWTARRLFGAVALAIVGLALLTLGLAMEYYPAISPPRKIVGFVQSNDGLNVGRHPKASIRLAGGNVVFASILLGGTLSGGEAVIVLEQPRLIGPPSYVVIGKGPQ